MTRKTHGPDVSDTCRILSNARLLHLAEGNGTEAAFARAELRARRRKTLTVTNHQHPTHVEDHLVPGPHGQDVVRHEAMALMAREAQCLAMHYSAADETVPGNFGCANLYPEMYKLWAVAYKKEVTYKERLKMMQEILDQIARKALMQSMNIQREIKLIKED